jgi:hypothetical protein
VCSFFFTFGKEVFLDDCHIFASFCIATFFFGGAFFVFVLGGLFCFPLWVVEMDWIDIYITFAFFCDLGKFFYACV